MGKLIYSAITSLDGFIEDPRADSTGPSPTKRSSASSMTSSVRSAPTSTGVGCTRRWSTGTRRHGRPTGPSRRVRHDVEGGRQDRVLHVPGGGVQCPDPNRAQIRCRSDPGTEGRPDGRHHGGGPNLADQAFEAGLVDECQLFLTPVVIGRGQPSLPDDVRSNLELIDERRFNERRRLPPLPSGQLVTEWSASSGCRLADLGRVRSRAGPLWQRGDPISPRWSSATPVTVDQPPGASGFR